MHRSSSYYLQSSSSSVATGAAASGPTSTAGVMDVDQLPTYDPRSDVAKKEAMDASRSRTDLALALVHLIPVVVLLCGLLLWSLSNTDFPEVGVLVEKGDDRTTVARVIRTIMPHNSGSAANWKGSVMISAMKDSDPIDKAHGTKRRMLLISEM